MMYLFNSSFCTFSTDFGTLFPHSLFQFFPGFFDLFLGDIHKLIYYLKSIHNLFIGKLLVIILFL